MNGRDSIPAFARYREIVDDFAEFAEACVRPLPTSVWANTLVSSREQLRRLLTERRLDAKEIGWFPDGFVVANEAWNPGFELEFLAGHFHVQEEVSLIPVRLLDPQPGERLIDLCAAPGGKTVQAAVAMRNRGTVVANDRNIHRIRALRGVTERLGLTNIVATIQSATNLSRRIGSYDRVIADVPCSAEGTTRKNPKVRLENGGRDRSGIVGVQTAILRKGVQVCRPGGRIVYSTCTFAPEENEGVVDTVLSEWEGELRVVPAQIDGLPSSPGITTWGGRTYHPDLQHALRFWPHHRDTGGFFSVLLERHAESAPRRNEVEEGVRVEPVDVERCLAHLRERFGVETSQLDGIAFVPSGRRFVSMISADLAPPPAELVHFLGAHFYHVDKKTPMPTTAIARRVGAAATRNVVDLNEDQIGPYARRERFDVDDVQVRGGASRGSVIVAYRSIAIGAGFLREGEARGGWEVESYFPKGLSLVSRF